MNWDRIEGASKQRRGKAVRHWGRVMNDELAGAAGRYEQLVGELQERFGSMKEAAADRDERVRTIAADLHRINRNLAALLGSMTRSGQKKKRRVMKAPD